MTMFYMEPGTYEPEDVPELFKIRNKIVPAVLVSQFTNTMIKGVPASLPYQQPKHTISYDEAAAACGRKGKGWHLMTNTEFVYLLHEAEELGHTIGGNTNYGSNSKNEQESGVRYDSAGRTLTGCDPSHGPMTEQQTACLVFAVISGNGSRACVCTKALWNTRRTTTQQLRATQRSQTGPLQR